MTKKAKKGGRQPSPHVRREGETDMQFARRVVTQERDRVRSQGGPVLTELKEAVLQLQQTAQLLRELAERPRESLLGSREAILGIDSKMLHEPSASVGAWCRKDDAPAERDCTCIGVCRGEQAGERCALKTDGPRGWQIRARTVWRTLAGREPDAAEELALESNWDTARHTFAGAGMVYALSWFASALAAFLKEHPRGSALQWLKQVHTQFDLTTRIWDHASLKFADSDAGDLKDRVREVQAALDERSH